ncbi:MAG TPA: hypothetical protein VLT32_02550 [Candidatus Sulfomarinibacteraceae bacterium]|nr:hypothetical protein [Candidatus Sulfomarinibacteraceae bacterium]
MRHSKIVLVIVLTLTTVAAAAEPPTGLTREQAEIEGIDLVTPGLAPAAVEPVPATAPPKGSLQLDLLLIPDSTADTIMAFDPTTGNLINQNFIVDFGATPNFQTPICAILNHDATGILVSDQLSDVVFEFDLAGNYVGIFAPAGGPNTAILDNIRGISLRANGNLLVTVGSGTNAGAIAEFDTSGAYVGNFIAPGLGGITSPFDVYYQPTAVMVNEITNDQVLEYDGSGGFVGVLTPVNNFPEQITRAADGNYLVANFGGTQEGILDIQPDGTVVAVYDPTVEGGYRGVYELPSGNLLVTTGVGVYEITRAVPSTIVETKITGVSARFVSYTEEPVPVELQSFSAE